MTITSWWLRSLPRGNFVCIDGGRVIILIVFARVHVHGIIIVIAIDFCICA